MTMSSSNHPAEPPPTYEIATGSSSRSLRRVSTDGPAARKERNGIPPERRRSMEDEARDLPEGWVRSYDPQSQHQFFVDTKTDPPRSIWVHPYDDEEFLSTLSPEERKRHARVKRTMTHHDLAAEDSDHDHDNSELPPRPNAKGESVAGSSTDTQPTGIHKFSRKLKDKVTGQTHEEREAYRVHRAKQEREAYQAHLRARQALNVAIETGQPQFLCKDQQGRDIYIEPPNGPYAPRGAYGYNPYSMSDAYANPNARFIRPAQPYARPYGYGYGGGVGFPLVGGLLGGALLGSILF